MSKSNTSPWRTWRTRWSGLVACLGAFVAFGTGAFAQNISAYTFSEAAGSYAALGGTSAAGAVSDDGSVDNIGIGFTFQFGPNLYTTFSINANGWMRLGGAIPGTPWTNSSANWTAAAYRPIIAPVWDDNNSSTGAVTYSTTGSPGTQVLTVDYNNVRVGSTGGTGGGSMNYQVKLYEGTNVVEFIYGSMTTTNTVSATIGLSDASGFHCVTPAATSTSSTATQNHAINATVLANTANKKYTFTPPPPPSCPGVLALAISGATTSSISGSWNVVANATGGYNWEVRTSGVGGSGATGLVSSGNVGTNSVTVGSLSANTAYSLWIQSNCGVDGTSTWVSASAFTGYCVPTVTNAGDYISSFSTTNGVTNISNATGAASPGNYGDFTAQTVSAPQNTSFNYSLAYVGGTNGIRVWVDWNNNLVFEAGELMSTVGTGASPQNGTVTVPAATPNGNYRMRVRAAWNVLPTGPCNNESYGETEDYTLAVVDPPACPAPTAVNITGILSNGATVNWTCASCTGTYIIEYGAPGFTPGTGATAGTGTVVTSATTSVNLAPALTANTAYAVVVRQECTAGSSYSFNTTPVTFQTACAPLTAPATQNFNAYSATTIADWPAANCISATPQGTGTPFHWDRTSGLTPSTGTGPNTAWDGMYAYTEASSGIAGDIALLTMQAVDVSTLTVPALTFHYHMYGVNMGTLNVQASTDGVNYTTVLSYVGQQQTTGDDDWREASVPLGAYAGGDLYIRFQAIRGSSFEGDISIDDVAVVEAPTCLVPTGLAVTAFTATSVSASWTVEPNAGSYNWEVRTSGTPGSGPSGLVDSGTSGTNSFTSTLLAANTTYQLYVQSDCSANSDGLSAWSAGVSVFTGYCAAGATDDGFEKIGQVQFAEVDNASTFEAGSNYSDFSALVGSVAPGVAVPFTITYLDDEFYADDRILIWADLNNDLDFDDVGELLYSQSAPPTDPIFTDSFTVPEGTTGGVYRLRIRLHDSVLGPNATPCGNSTYGEVEDYSISVCEAPVATGTLVEDCTEQTFTVSVTMTDAGSGASHVIAYSVNGVPQTPVAYAGAGTELPAQPVHVVVTASLVSDDGCSVDLGEFRSTCDIELDCEAASPIQMAHCYDNGDTQTWTWVNTEVGGTVSLKFISGSVEVNDNILLWEGAVGGTPAVPSSLTGTLDGVLVTSVGNTLSMSIFTDGSNSCADNGVGLGAGWVFQARCGGCVEPSGFVTADPNELGEPEVDCAALPVATFNAYVGILDNGIDGNTGLPPATVGYRLFVNNVAQPDVTGLPGGEYYLLGAFPLGTDIDVILLHEDQATQAACNTQVATDFTVAFNACPPANDQCENAQVLTLNPDGTCPTNSITGTTLGADQTGALPGCQATGVAQDVWYTFNSGSSNTFTMTLTAATAGNIGVELFTACGTPVSGACLANILPVNNPITVTVTSGTDYWLRVFTNVSTGAPGTFNICVSAFDPCADIENIAACNTVVTATRAAGNGAWDGYGGPYAVPGREKVYTFTPVLTGTHTVEVTSITGSWVDFYYKEASVGCNNTGWTYVDDMNAAGFSAGFTLTAGTQYYIMWDAEDNTAARTVSFRMSCPVPAPANDDCAGAIALTVNGGLTCTTQTAGTVAGATDSGVAPSCGTADDDVWYSFVAASASHTITLNNVAGTNTDMAFSVYADGCGTLTPVTCSDPNSTTLTGLTVGATYYVQVYTWNATAGANTTYNVCVTTPPAPGSECNAAINIVTFPVVNQAIACSGAALPGLLNATNVPTTCGGASTSYMGGEEALYTFTPATTADYLVSISGQTWTGIFVYANACPTNGGTCVGSIGSSTAAKSLVVPMTAGVTYYIWFDTFPAPNSPCPGTFSIGFAPLPPANDNCGGAVALTVNPNYSCGSVTAGTVAWATASPEDPAACGGTEDDDVWYSFVATSTTHRISLLNVAGSTTDMYHSLWTGGCGSLTLVPGSCSDADISNPTGLTPGTTYFLRVYTWTGTAGQNSTFNVCIGTAPPPPANDECAGAVNLPVSTGLTCSAQTAGTLTSSTNSGLAVAPCTGTADDDVWYRFTATSIQHIITLSGVTPSTTMRMQLFSGACGTLTHLSCGTVDAYTTPNTLVPGTQYYLRVYSNGATAVEVNFNICVTTPPVGPPANDECAGAIGLTVNAGQTCVAQTFGTVFGATGTLDATCAGGEDDDVWYSFVATGPVHTVSLNSVAGSVTSMNFQVRGGTCGAPTNIVCSSTGATASAVATGLTAGNTYYVRVYTNTTTGNQNTTFNVCVTSPPANDLCSNAIPVACNSVVSGTTVGATNTGRPTGTCTDVAINDPYVDNSAAGVWYTVTGWGGTMRASLCGSSFDTQIGVFTGSCGTFTCVAGNDDAGTACASSGTRSIATWNSIAGTTYYIYVTAWTNGTTGDFTLTTTCGSTQAVCAANGLNLEFQNDANPGQVTWEVLNAAGNALVLNGTNPIPANAIGNQSICLPNGCYRLRVLDSAGDGMTTGGYILRNSGDGARIIDNKNNFSTGSVSAIANGGSFCLPIGTDKLIYSSCDKLDWVANKFIVASANPAVSAQFGVANSTSGYEFWFYDPNGSFSYRRFRSHSTSDGFGTGATRACHFKVNGWFQSVANPHLPANVLLNVRIRGRVAGNNLEFGPACQFKIDPVLASCPRVKLQDDPSNTADFSCGVTRNFGGPGSAANRIYANPPQPIPVVASNMVRYQFRFRIPGENICIVRPPQTSAQMTLSWTNGTPLECSKTYEVDVRVSLDAGATWCFGPATSDATAACADVEPWGKVCNVTITPCASADGGANSMATESNSTFTMYPNPNRGDQLFMSVSSVEEGVNTVSVDIFDMTGKRVMARTIAVQDGFINTNLELNGDLAGGLYVVSVTAGTKAYTERLVIQP